MTDNWNAAATPISGDDAGNSNNRPTNKVTGGDLEDLWNVANQNLPTVQDAYHKQINNMTDAITGPDAEKFGPCHPWWTIAAQTYRDFLDYTSRSLQSVSVQMNVAIDEYKYVDGSNGEELTKIGKELEYIVRETPVIEPTPVSSDYDPFHFDLPPDWSE